MNVRRQLFFLLWGLGLLGTVAVVPYVIMLQSGSLQPIALRAGGTVLNAALSTALLIYLGLRAGKSLNLGAPILERWVATGDGRQAKDQLRPLLLLSLVGGAVGAVVVSVVDTSIFVPRLPEMAALPTPAWWARLLASLYGGITEELIFRLGWLTIEAWFLSRFHIGKFRLARPAIMWGANIIAALMFAGGHLPIASASLEGVLQGLTPLMITRVLTLNGMLGLFFGHLYWTRSLEAAMLAHLTTDIALAVFSILFTII